MYDELKDISLIYCNSVRYEMHVSYTIFGIYLKRIIDTFF